MGQKGKKSAKVTEEAIEDEVEEKTLPTVDDSPELKKIAEASQEAKKKKKAASEAESEAEKKKSFLSISNTTQDGERPKVPSYSAAKNRGVVYISHIPHGFYERQMRQFFEQFGAVTNLRLGRSKKTGKSCGFAFVEFKYLEVAKIVSESMNNYLMFDKILKCSVVPQERVSKKIFKNKINPNRPPKKSQRVKAKKMHNSAKEEDTLVKNRNKQMKKMGRINKKLEDAGI